MNNLSTSLTTMRAQISHEYEIPFFVKHLCNSFQYAHLFYRTFKRYTVITKTTSGNQADSLIYGGLITISSESSNLFQKAVIVALVAKCACDLTSQYQQISFTLKEIKATLYQTYPHYPKVQWKKRTLAHLLIFPSTLDSLQIKTHRILETIKKVSRCCFRLFWEIFKLSMSLCDIYLLAKNDKQAKFDATTELVAEWKNYANQLSSSRKLLFSELRKIEPRIRSFVESLSLPNIAYCIKELEVQPSINHESTKSSETFFESLREDFGRACNDFQQSVNFSKFTRIEHIIPHEPEFDIQRYPPWGGELISKIICDKSLSQENIQPMSHKISSASAFQKGITGLIKTILSPNKKHLEITD